MNISKRKICVICNKEKFIFSKKRCKECAMVSYKSTKTDYKSFFDEYLKNNRHIDFENGETILYANRSNCCHIFPKSIYKSIAQNNNNIILLSLENHTTLDNHLFKMEFDEIEKKLPKVYKEIMNRASILLPLITEKSGVLYLKIKELTIN